MIRAVNETIQKLVEHPATDLNFLDYQGSSIIFRTLKNPTLLNYLMRHVGRGIKLDILNYQDLTPLMITVRNENWYVVDLLVANGADPWVKNGAGKTCLDMARELKPHTVRILEEILKKHNKEAKTGWFS